MLLWNNRNSFRCYGGLGLTVLAQSFGIESYGHVHSCVSLPGLLYSCPDIDLVMCDRRNGYRRVAVSKESGVLQAW